MKKALTVKELINHLKNLEPDSMVRVQPENSECHPGLLVYDPRYQGGYFMFIPQADDPFHPV